MSLQANITVSFSPTKCFEKYFASHMQFPFSRLSRPAGEAHDAARMMRGMRPCCRDVRTVYHARDGRAMNRTMPIRRRAPWCCHDAQGEPLMTRIMGWCCCASARGAVAHHGGVLVRFMVSPPLQGPVGQVSSVGQKAKATSWPVGRLARRKPGGLPARPSAGAALLQYLTAWAAPAMLLGSLTPIFWLLATNY